MTEHNHAPLLEAEIESFSRLEEKIDQLLERMEALKQERDLAVAQRSETEELLRRRETEIEQLKQKLEEAQTRTLDPEKESVIREKLTGLLNKLDNI